MSQFSTSHNVISNEDGKAIAYSGQRLSTAWWKLTEAMKAKGITQVHKPIAVSIPMITSIPDHYMVALKPHLIALLESAQDKIIRAKVEAGATEVNDSDIGLDACIEFLNAEGTSSRLTKESISVWFNSTVADMLTISLADKLGIGDTPTSDQARKLEQMVSVVREKIASLAGAKTSFSQEHATKLVQVLRNCAPEDDMLAARFISRMEGMSKVQDDVMDAL